MRKVTNNHDARLSVAGSDIAPGATVGIESTALRMALNSKTLQQWVTLELIEIEGLEELLGGGSEDKSTTVQIPGMPVVLTREQLEAKATELKISFQANTKDETLVKKIAEAEKANADAASE